MEIATPHESALLTWCKTQMYKFRLNEQNPHPRDERVKRVMSKGGGRKYLIDGTRILEGVTSVLEDDFDAEEVSAQCAGRGRYRGMDAEQVRELWRVDGDWAATLGTRMHQRIQNYYDFNTRDWFAHQTLYEGETMFSLEQEWNKFKAWEAWRLERKWQIYWAEHIVFDEKREIPLAGEVDALFRSDEGFHVVDWKRQKKFNEERKRDKAKRQVKLYADIINARYDDIEVVTGTVVCIHPDCDDLQLLHFEV